VAAEREEMNESDGRDMTLKTCSDPSGSRKAAGYIEGNRSVDRRD
jgi:hypothetical protein